MLGDLTRFLSFGFRAVGGRVGGQSCRKDAAVRKCLVCVGDCELPGVVRGRGTVGASAVAGRNGGNCWKLKRRWGGRGGQLIVSLGGSWCIERSAKRKRQRVASSQVLRV